MKCMCYIINYNAKEYLIQCLDSVICACGETEGVEICVVDNASNDGSVEAVRDRYDNKVRVIVNDENTGGAGGFNTALKDAIECKVDYAVLLDNDIKVDRESINNMLSLLCDNDDVGAVGAKIMTMDRPDFIQEFGGHLDMDHYYFTTDYWYELDNGTEGIIESDWLSSCAIAVRIEAVKKTHLFPQENFLYWDDIQFTWEMKQAGYRLVSLAAAKVWHKGKKKVVTNTASAYYAMRNRTKFFSICEDENKLDKLCESLLEEYFDIFFGSSLKGLDSTNSSRMMALDDFVNKRYGKIPQRALFDIVIKDEESDVKKEDYVFCEHVTKVKENILPKIWVDKYSNKISTEDDYRKVQAYPHLKEMFVKLHYEWLMNGIVEERKRYKEKV